MFGCVNEKNEFLYQQPPPPPPSGGKKRISRKKKTTHPPHDTPPSIEYYYTAAATTYLGDGMNAEADATMAAMTMTDLYMVDGGRMERK